MDLFSWMRKHPWLSVGIATILIVIIPIVIDKIFTTPSFFPIFVVHYKPEDVLSFYGIILGSITTIVALIETIQHTEKMYMMDYERKLTPVLDSNLYNHSSTSKMPLRVLYVNTHPINNFFDEIKVMSQEEIDWRDLEDTFFHCQIDYLVQNISNTSAVDIKVFLNGNLLHGPFSLVAGGEESIGICFLDKTGLMISDYPTECEFDIKLLYTNANRAKVFKQTEKIKIEYHLMRYDGGPQMIPDYRSRNGLSDQTVQEKRNNL